MYKITSHDIHSTLCDTMFQWFSNVSGSVFVEEMTAASDADDLFAWLDENIYDQWMVNDDVNCTACLHMTTFDCHRDCQRWNETGVQLEDSLFQPYNALAKFCSHCIDHFENFRWNRPIVDSKSSTNKTRCQLMVQFSEKREVGVRLVRILHGYLHGRFVNFQNLMNELNEILDDYDEDLNCYALDCGMIAIFLDMEREKINVDETLVGKAVKVHLQFASEVHTKNIKSLAQTFTDLPYTVCFCRPRCYPCYECPMHWSCLDEMGGLGYRRFQPYYSQAYLGSYLKILFFWDKATTGFRGMSDLQWCTNAWILALHHGYVNTLIYLDNYSFGPGPLAGVVTEEITKLLKSLFLCQVFCEEGLRQNISTKIISYLECMYFLADCIYGYRWLVNSRLLDLAIGIMNYFCHIEGCQMNGSCSHDVEYSYADMLQIRLAVALCRTERLQDLCWRTVMRNIKVVQPGVEKETLLKNARILPNNLLSYMLHQEDNILWHKVYQLDLRIQWL